MPNMTGTLDLPIIIEYNMHSLVLLIKLSYKFNKSNIVKFDYVFVSLYGTGV